MTEVNTVMGSMSVDELGTTLIHEHVSGSLPGQPGIIPVDADERRAVAVDCAQALEAVKSCGLVTIVDATPIDFGRDVDLIKEVSAISGINIVCATGFYREMSDESGGTTPDSQKNSTVDELYELFRNEIVQGIGSTGIKAGVIKVGTGHGSISAYEERVLKAAARAQKDTGVPIITHTEAGTMGLEQADMLISEGVDPKRIMIGHRGANTDLKHHVSVLERGVYIAFDRFGLEFEVTDVIRKACIIGLIGIGYADRIMLSNDYIVHQPGSTPDSRKSVKASGFNWSCEHVFENIIPGLKEAGVTDDTIETIMVRNPRRLLAG